MVSDNGKIIKYHWSSFCLLLTLGLTLLFVFIIYKMIHSNPIPGCAISSVIIGLMVYTILQCHSLHYQFKKTNKYKIDWKNY